MTLPNWIKNKTWQFVISIFVAVLAIIVPLIFLHSPPSNRSFELAKELAKKIPDYQGLKEKDTEIQALKATIERLQLESGDELKKAALQALSEGNTKKAISLLEKSVQLRTEKAKQFSEKAAQDWVDIGNIAFLNDSLKALNAYQNAIRLDSSSLVAWNRLGRILSRLGRLEEAKQAYEHLLELAEKDESFQATAYGNLGIIYQIRGELDKAEEFYRKSLEIDKALGRQEGMASQYGNLGIIYKTRGELDKAEEFYRKSLDINKALGLQEGMAIQYGNLGVIYQTRGELDKACAYWQKSQELYLNIGAKPQSNMVGGWIIENCNIN